MSKERSYVSSSELADAVIQGMQDKKAARIVQVDLREVPNAVCDFFLICNGSSSTQVDAIARSIEEKTLELVNEKPWHIEGTENAEWILLDYANVVAHVFQKEAREFYDLEGLWADATIQEIEYQT